MKRSWSLERRITLSFGLTAGVLSLVLALAAGWAVHAAIQEEISALVREELDELRAYCSERTPTLEEFARIAEEMQREHAENRLALRIWDPSTGQLSGEYGEPELLARVPHAPTTEAVYARIDEHTRLASAPLGPRLGAAVVLDCRAQNERFVRFVASALAFTLLATVVVTIAGRLLGRRIARLLAQVAEGARTEGVAEHWPAPSEAPLEVRAVVQALQDTLRRIREEVENARLHTSGLAHELRSPLQNLMGETQVTLLRERTGEEYRRVLESQLEDLAELSRVVDNLVTLSSVEEARRRRTVESFDLAGEARLRLSREFHLARRRDVRLEFVASGPLQVEGDRESLLLALRNLVTNAIEWSPPGGLVEVRLQAAGEGLEVLVDDSGPGVPPEQRAQIFQPFRRGPAAEGRRVGFGLGLALTESAVRTQGGSIEVGDSPLGGARFRIVLPARA